MKRLSERSLPSWKNKVLLCEHVCALCVLVCMGVCVYVLLSSSKSCRQAPSLTVVMAFRAVSAPMLRSEPGTLLETVAGTMTIGTQNSSNFPRAADNSSSDSKACRAEPRALVGSERERDFGTVVGLREVLLATKEGKTKVKSAKGRSQVYHNGQQQNRQVLLHFQPTNTQMNKGKVFLLAFITQNN